MVNIRRILVAGIILLTVGEATADPPRTDALGDPLPPFALARSGSTRWRHGGYIDAIAVSPDGALIASHGVGDAVRVWDAKTGRLVRQFPPGAWGSHALAFSPDSKQLAMETHCVQLDAADRRGDLRVLVCWDIVTGEERVRKREPAPKETWPGSRSRNALAWTPPDRIVVAELSNGVVTVFDPLDQTSRRKLHLHKAATGGFAVRPDGERVCAVGGDGAVSTWDSKSGEFSDQWTAPGIDVGSQRDYSSAALAFTPDGKTLALTLSDGSLGLLDAATGKERKRFRGPIAQTAAMAFTPEGKTLVTSSHAPFPCIRLWDFETGKERQPLDRISPLTGLALSPGGQTFVVTDATKALRIGESAIGRESHRLADANARCPVLSPDGKLLAFVHDDTRIVVRDFADGKPGAERSRIDVGFKILTLIFSPDGKRLLVGCDNGDAYLYDATSGKPGPTLRTAGTSVRSVVFSPAGGLIVTVADAERSNGHPRRKLSRAVVQTWSAATGGELGLSPEFTRSAYTVVFHPDGQKLAALHLCAAAEQTVDPFNEYRFGVRHSLEDRTESIRLWDLDGRKEIARFDDAIQKERAATSGGFAPWSPPRPAVFAPDGHTFAVAVDREVVVYETAAGLARFRLTGHLGDVTGLAFAADGRTLVSCGADGLVISWDVTGLRAPDRLPGAAAEWWRALADADGATAGRAVWCLAEAPVQALPLLREKLGPVDEGKFTGWITALGSGKFTERESAQRELEWAGVAAAPALKNALEAAPAAEIRRRIEQLLAKLPPGKPSPAEVQALRAVEVLRRIDTPEARRLLEEAAKGAPAAYLTKAAKARR